MTFFRGGFRESSTYFGKLSKFSVNFFLVRILRKKNIKFQENINCPVLGRMPEVFNHLPNFLTFWKAVKQDG